MLPPKVPGEISLALPASDGSRSSLVYGYVTLTSSSWSLCFFSFRVSSAESGFPSLLHEYMWLHLGPLEYSRISSSFQDSYLDHIFCQIRQYSLWPCKLIVTILWIRTWIYFLGIHHSAHYMFQFLVWLSYIHFYLVFPNTMMDWFSYQLFLRKTAMTAYFEYISNKTWTEFTNICSNLDPSQGKLANICIKRKMVGRNFKTKKPTRQWVERRVILPCSFILPLELWNTPAFTTVIKVPKYLHLVKWNCHLSFLMLFIFSEASHTVNHFGHIDSCSSLGFQGRLPALFWFPAYLVSLSSFYFTISFA